MIDKAPPKLLMFSSPELKNMLLYLAKRIFRHDKIRDLEMGKLSELTSWAV